MKTIIATFLFLNTYLVFGQEGRRFFDYKDSSFTVGQIKIINESIWGCDNPFTPEWHIVLDSLVDFLEDNPHLTIEISLHTDFRGSKEFNQQLAQKRAELLVDYLKKKGISGIRLIPIGYGESKPIISEEKIRTIKDKAEVEKAHEINRRIEIKIMEI